MGSPSVLGPWARVDAGERAPRRVRPSDTFTFSKALLLVLLFVVLDVQGALNRGSLVEGTRLRYLVLLIPLGSIIYLRARSPSALLRKPTGADLLLFALFAYGLIGSAYGMLFRGTQSTGLPLFLPMALAFLYLATLEDISAAEARSLLRKLAAVGLIYLVLALLSAGGISSILASSRAFRNARLPFVAIAFSGALVGGQRGRLALVCAILPIIFLAYPSATFVMVALITVVTLFVTSPRASRLRTFVVAGSILTVAVFVLLDFNRALSVSSSYFATVGKQNNNETRLALYRSGIAEFERSPMIGQGFAGELNITARTESGTWVRLPFHDDFILMAAGGGGLAVLLFLAWIASTEVIVLARCRRLAGEGFTEHVALLRTLLVGYNAWLVSSLFNPLFQGLANSLTLFAIYGIMMAVAAQYPDRQPARP
jgi:hypothetical protein